MSCGSRIIPRYDSYSERRELADKLEREGEYRVADSVRDDRCLSDYDLRAAERALERHGIHKRWDYEERECACRYNDEDER